MAANEVIDLESGSSDDEFKDPHRIPIGWNYQGTASKSLEDMTRAKVNGTYHNPVKKDKCGDEIEILEVSDYKPSDYKPSEHKHKPSVSLPPSSSRSEIRKIIRNTTQSNISNFFPKSVVKKEFDVKCVKTETSEKNFNIIKGKTEVDSRPVETVKSVSQNNNTDTEKNTKSSPLSTNEKNSKSSPLSTNEKNSKSSPLSTNEKNSKSSPVSTNEKNSKSSPVSTNENNSKSSPVSTKESQDSAIKDKIENNNDDENSETSIAAVESFVSRWEELKCSNDDQKIRDKLWKYYYLAHSSYTHSKRFIRLVEGSTRRLSIDNIYVVVKDLLDSLKCYKDRPYRDKLEIEEPKSNGETSNTALPLPEDTEEDKKRNQKLRKVEKKMKEISDKIRELECQDIDLDDEDNSAYLIEDRLKRQFSKLHDYYCKIAECTPATGRPIERKFRYEGSRYEEVNKRISTWVNKTKEFPDYVDILNLLKKVTKESSLPLRPETVRVQAQEIFRDVGRMLKDRRESDDLYSIYSYIDDAGEEDPATKDDDLSKKLSDNEVVAKEKLDKIFQEYVEKEAEARETADRNAKKTDTKVEANKEGETSTNKERESAIEKQMEEEDDDVDDEVYEHDDPYLLDDDEDTEEDEEEIDDKEVIIYPNSKEYDDLGEDTDDELRDVIASASVEEDLSEEDVPVIDSEDIIYEEEEYGSSSSIVCLDDTSSDSTMMVAEPIKKHLLPTHVMDSSCKKREFDEDFSPQKRLCVDGSNP